MSSRLWRALEEIPGLHAVLPEWRLYLGDELESFRRFLTPTDRFASAIPSPHDPYSVYRVVRHAADDIVGVDDANRSKIPLSREDVLIYRLDHQRFVRHVAAALGIDHACSVVDSVPQSYRIGALATAEGVRYPAYLTIPIESDDLLRAVEFAAAQHNDAFLMLAPTDGQMRPSCEQLLQQRHACFLPLGASIEIDGKGKWTATGFAKQRISHFMAAQAPPEKMGNPSGSKARSKGTRIKAELISWTQVDLDNAIREYKASRASTYSDLVSGVRAGRPGAKKAAREMFGRNAIARALKVKAPAMVTKSPVWQAIADELHIPRGKNRNRRGTKIGLDIAMEHQAARMADPTVADVVRRETIHAIDTSLARREAAALRDQLERGEITDEDALRIIEVTKDQQRDLRTRRMPSAP